MKQLALFAVLIAAATSIFVGGIQGGNVIIVGHRKGDSGEGSAQTQKRRKFLQKRGPESLLADELVIHLQDKGSRAAGDQHRGLRRDPFLLG